MANAPTPELLGGVVALRGQTTAAQHVTAIPGCAGTTGARHNNGVGGLLLTTCGVAPRLIEQR